jgi:hypothetical protein
MWILEEEMASGKRYLHWIYAVIPYLLLLVFVRLRVGKQWVHIMGLTSKLGESQTGLYMYA